MYNGACFCGSVALIVYRGEQSLRCLLLSFPGMANVRLSLRGRMYRKGFRMYEGVFPFGGVTRLACLSYHYSRIVYRECYLPASLNIKSLSLQNRV